MESRLVDWYPYRLQLYFGGGMCLRIKLISDKPRVTNLSLRHGEILHFVHQRDEILGNSEIKQFQPFCHYNNIDVFI